jgi:hypothetical protein
VLEAEVRAQQVGERRGEATGPEPTPLSRLERADRSLQPLEGAQGTQVLVPAFLLPVVRRSAVTCRPRSGSASKRANLVAPLALGAPKLTKSIA